MFKAGEQKETFLMVQASQNMMEKAQSRSLAKQKKTAEGNKAAAEYLAEVKARNLKTARLRALRLAKEAADRAAEALKPAEPKKRASRAAKSKTPEL
jgi:hypothetical protein